MIKAPRPYLPGFDGLRGLGALVIALFEHYKFFMAPALVGGSSLLDAPGYSYPAIEILYRYGYSAVDLFFLLSGVVFQHIYSESEDLRRFIWHRVARLYPAHLFTMALAAIFAWNYHAMAGRFPLYEANGWVAALFNLVFLQAFLIKDHHVAWSFNGPSWSLSIEVALYVLFWFIRKNALVTMLYAAIGLTMFAMHDNDLARGVTGFFLGCLIARLRHQSTAVCVAGMVGYIFVLGGYYLLLVYCLRLGDLKSVYMGCPIAWLIFGPLLMLMRVFPRLAQLLDRNPLRYLGYISLSIYLIHVPVQMVILSASYAFHWPVPATSLWFFMSYAATVLLAASALTRFVERPARDAIRRWADAR